jgi:hypothetical protein
MTPDLTGVDLEKLAAVEPNAPLDWSPTEVLPPGWKVDSLAVDGAFYRHSGLGLIAALSCSTELDGRVWLHVSVSRRSRIPSWDDISLVKEIFLGDREAVIVMPPRARYVNIHPFVLHAFALRDPGEMIGLPDFTRGTGSL